MKHSALNSTCLPCSTLIQEIRESCDRASEKTILEIDPIEGFTVRPHFFLGSRGISCLQEKYVGFFLLASCIRSVYTANSFLVGADCLLRERLLAPSVSLSYTSAYHTLRAHMAFNGRYWIDRPDLFDNRDFEAPESRSCQQPQSLEAVVCIFNGNSKSWSYERRRSSHIRYWKELIQVYPKSRTLPAYFEGLFAYLFRGCSKPYKDLLHRIENPSLYRYKCNELFEEFLQEIASIRHEAVYKGGGEDPFVRDELIEREPMAGPEMLSLRAERLREFAKNFLRESASMLEALLEAAKPGETTKSQLRVRIEHFSGADFCSSRTIEDTALADSLRKIEAILSMRKN